MWTRAQGGKDLYCLHDPHISALPPPGKDRSNQTSRSLLVRTPASSNPSTIAVSTLNEYAKTPSEYQSRDERIICATNNYRTTLLASYAAHSDLGTGGLYGADTNVRGTINRGITPGPRLFVVTKTITSSNGYAFRQDDQLGGTTVPHMYDSATASMASELL
ncbi:hypothetical protein K432DRAFT_409969 [Lepidopterella palustris CBS 459.81]|uniref:Uncharacterized protein n=1 Tax=Lepidopterella palustris CBS 459.81 TaxID=1314670 RepID=A0A8E2DZ90_9PEZI|nr:hypothetical protein K432DRAFT_409969 [Lepidopterella palustris CBS 459.81]